MLWHGNTVNVFHVKGRAYVGMFTTEAVFRRCSLKYMFLNILQISKENTGVRGSLIKFQAWRAAILLKRDFNRDLFLWNLRNFSENDFLKSTSSGCFRYKEMSEP